MARDGRPGQDGQQGQWPGDGGGWRPPEWEGGQDRNGQRGYQPGATQSYFQPAPPAQPPYGPPPPPRGKSWPARHKALTGVLGLAALIIIIVAVGAGGPPGSRTPTGLTTPATATATGTPVKQATQAATVTHKALPAPAPATRAAVAPPPATQAAVAPPPASAAAPAACSPLTNGGKCYEPGEFCRNADHGASGVAGDGKAITCEDNDGWRWESS